MQGSTLGLEANPDALAVCLQPCRKQSTNDVSMSEQLDKARARRQNRAVVLLLCVVHGTAACCIRTSVMCLTDCDVPDKVLA
jgi:hypothetical protein